jgi:hypothetical protein
MEFILGKTFKYRCTRDWSQKILFAHLRKDTDLPSLRLTVQKKAGWVEGQMNRMALN